MVWVEGLRGNKEPQELTMCGQICGKMCLTRRNAKKSKSGSEKPKLDNARKLRGIYVIDSADAKFKKTIF